MPTRQQIELKNQGRRFMWSYLDSYLSADSRIHNTRNAKEIMGISPANFTVTKKQALREDGKTPLDSWYIERDDTKTVLCPHVGPDWTVVQNIDKFDWFQPYLDSGMFEIAGAGTMKGGQIVSIFAKVNLPDEEIVKDDPVSYYIHLYDSFGERSLSFQSVVARLVCLNGMVRNDSDKHLRIRHKKNIGQRMKDASEFGSILGEKFQALAEKYKFMAHRPIRSETELRNFIKSAFLMKEKENKKGQVCLPTRSENIITTIIDMHDARAGIVKQLLEANEAFEEEKKNGEANLLEAVLETTEAKTGLVRGTYWGAYNAVTEYLNHERGNSKETRIDSLLYGDSYRVEQRAFDLALGKDTQAA